MPTHIHTHTSPTRISSHIASKHPDLSSVDPHSEEAAAQDGAVHHHACFPMHFPLAGLAMQFAYDPCQWRGEKRAHFWFVSFCSPTIFLYRSGTHTEQKPCAATSYCNRREDGIRGVPSRQLDSGNRITRTGHGDHQPATAIPVPLAQHNRSHVRMTLRFSTGLFGAPDSHEFVLALSLSGPCDTRSPARIDGKLPVLSCMRASALRAPTPWIYC